MNVAKQPAAAGIDAAPEPQHPEPPRRLSFPQGAHLRITYTVDIIVGQLTLEWLNDVNRNAKRDDGEAWDAVNSKGDSTVTIDIPSLPAGATFVQWLFAPANESKWRGELKIGRVSGAEQTYVQHSRAKEPFIFQHWLFIDAIA